MTVKNRGILNCMKAIISDIHGNLEALEAVLLDARVCGATEIYCLGDLIGYGPDGPACVRHATQWDVVLCGDYERALFQRSHGAFEYRMPKVVRQFAAAEDEIKLTRFLACLEPQYSAHDALYVHGSPRHPLGEYLFPEDVYNQQKMDKIAGAFEGLCFCGHTHIPGIFDMAAYTFIDPIDINLTYDVHADDKLICNVGSVGQPRNGDPNSSYVLFDGARITFRRIEYDIEAVIRKLDDEDDWMGDRLREGR